MQIAASQAQEELKVKVAIFDPAYMSKEVAKNLGFGKVGHAEEIEISHMLYKKPELIKMTRSLATTSAEKNYINRPCRCADTFCIPSTLEDQKRLVEATGDASPEGLRKLRRKRENLSRHL
jgi:creatinine amidohydrolase